MDNLTILLIILVVLLVINIGVSSASLYKLNKEKWDFTDFDFSEATPVNSAMFEQGEQGPLLVDTTNDQLAFSKIGFSKPMPMPMQEQPETSQTSQMMW